MTKINKKHLMINKTKNMNLNQAIKFIEKQIKDPKVGLPEEVFLFISRITPLVNVDLLIQDENGRTLLSWRDDIHGAGWHIPGGIIRFKEHLEDRLKKVAIKEIGTEVKFDQTPIAFNEIILKHKNRGHFMSFLYKCFLPSSFVPKNLGLKETDKGYLKWHDFCPSNLIKVHGIYKKFICKYEDK